MFLKYLSDLKVKIICTVHILTSKKENDQMPLFFLPLRKMNEITYVKKIRDKAYPILHRI